MKKLIILFIAIVYGTGTIDAQTAKKPSPFDMTLGRKLIGGHIARDSLISYAREGIVPIITSLYMDYYIKIDSFLVMIQHSSKITKLWCHGNIPSKEVLDLLDKLQPGDKVVFKQFSFLPVQRNFGTDNLNKGLHGDEQMSFDIK